MRAIISVFLIFSLILIGGFLHLHAIKSYTDDFSSYIPVIEKSVEEKDTSKLYYSLTLAEEKWLVTRKKLAFLINHEYIFEVDSAITELYGFSKAFDEAEAMLSVAKMKAAVGCIVETSALTFQNII